MVTVMLQKEIRQELLITEEVSCHSSMEGSRYLHKTRQNGDSGLRKRYASNC